MLRASQAVLWQGHRVFVHFDRYAFSAHWALTLVTEDGRPLVRATVQSDGAAALAETEVAIQAWDTESTTELVAQCLAAGVITPPHRTVLHHGKPAMVCHVVAPSVEAHLVASA